MPATYEPIATTTLGATAASIDFTSISSAFTDLRLVVVFGTSNGNDVRLRFNNSGATDYSWTRLLGDGTASSSRFSNQTYIELSPGVASPTTPTAMTIIDIFSYAGSTNKTVLVSTSMDRNTSGGAVSRIVGLWRSTSAITDVKFFTSGADLPIGTTATLYGILKA